MTSVFWKSLLGDSCHWHKIARSGVDRTPLFPFPGISLDGPSAARSITPRFQNKSSSEVKMEIILCPQCGLTDNSSRLLTQREKQLAQKWSFVLIFFVPLPPTLDRKIHHSLLIQRKAPYKHQICDFSFRNNVTVLALCLLPSLSLFPSNLLEIIWVSVFLFLDSCMPKGIESQMACVHKIGGIKPKL